MLIGDVLERNAALFGNLPAVVYQGDSVTHRELLARARRTGNALRGLGLQRQDRVLILAQNCIEFIELIGAVSLTGMISVGLNYRLSEAEQLHIVRDCDPAIWIYEAQYADRVRSICAQLASAPILVCVGGEPSQGGHEYRQLQSAASDERPDVRVTGEDTVFLIYTSGTTGHPKGVMHGQQAQVAHMMICSNAFSVNPTDRALVVMPFYHVGAINIYLGYAWAGAAIVLHRAFDVVEVFESLDANRVTAALFAPVMIQSLLNAPDEVRRKPQFLRTIVYSSSPMPVPLLKRAIAHFGPVFIQVYGATENVLGTVMYKHQHQPDGAPGEKRRLASAGQSYFGCRIEIRGPDGSVCATGEVGEVAIFSPALMQGYWNNTIATLTAVRDGWYCSGDLGYLDEDQFLFLVDRKKDMIISGGENIYSREVEEALLTHASVMEAAVVGVPDAHWGESVMAFVVCTGDPPLAQELVDHCRRQIASYKKPRHVRFVEALPRVPSTNKIDKKALRDPQWTGMGQAG